MEKKEEKIKNTPDNKTQENQSAPSFSFNNPFKNTQIIDFSIKLISEEEIEKQSQQILKDIVKRFMLGNWGTDTFREHKEVTVTVDKKSIFSSAAQTITHKLPGLAADIVNKYNKAILGDESLNKVLLYAEKLLQDAAYLPSEVNFFSCSTETVKLYNEAFDSIQEKYHTAMIGDKLIEEHWGLLKNLKKYLQNLETDHQDLRGKVVNRIDLLMSQKPSSIVEKRAALNYLSFVLFNYSKDGILFLTRNKSPLYNEIMKIIAILNDKDIGIKRIELNDKKIVLRDDKNNEFNKKTLRSKGEGSELNSIWLRRFELKYKDKMQPTDLLFLKVNIPEISNTGLKT